MLSQAEHISELLKSKKEEIQNRFGIEHLLLYGSYAKGLQNMNSDIDLMYEMQPTSKMTLRRLEQLEVRIAGLLQMPKVELVNRKYMNPLVFLEIKEYGINIF